MIVEVCANSLQSAINAQKSGAHRIELCSELSVGGITPSYGLITQVCKKIRIPIHVLIRPRGGHFCYNKSEVEVMQADIKFCKEIGVAGVVMGALTEDRRLNLSQIENFLDLANGMHFTFHRAFDWLREPMQSLNQLEYLGVETVLTSGQETTAVLGLHRIIEWQAATGITLMAGGGINAQNAILFKKARLKAIHLTGSSMVREVSVLGTIPINSSKHWVENKVAETDGEQIRQTIINLK